MRRAVAVENDSSVPYHQHAVHRIGSSGEVDEVGERPRRYALLFVRRRLPSNPLATQWIHPRRRDHRAHELIAISITAAHRCMAASAVLND
jgi:hypothetical protein